MASVAVGATTCTKASACKRLETLPSAISPPPTTRTGRPSNFRNRGNNDIIQLLNLSNQSVAFQRVRRTTREELRRTATTSDMRKSELLIKLRHKSKTHSTVSGEWV